MARAAPGRFLAPEGYEAVYRTNAITKHGEHGNALLTRWLVVGYQHEDIGPLFRAAAACCMCRQVQNRLRTPSVHLGLIPGQPVRQAAPAATIEREGALWASPWWWPEISTMGPPAPAHLGAGLVEFEAPRAYTTWPGQPLAQLDHVYARGLTPVSLYVPRGRIWWRMSDHLPLDCRNSWPDVCALIPGDLVST